MGIKIMQRSERQGGSALERDKCWESERRCQYEEGEMSDMVRENAFTVVAHNDVTTVPLTSMS